MTAFTAGMRVRCRDAEWMVTRVETADAAGTHSMVHCRGVDSLVKNHDAIFLTQLDTIEPVRPEDTRLVTDTSAGFRRAKLYLEAQLRSMPAMGTAPDLERMGAFDPLPFQRRAVELALEQPRVRLLLSDAVGLGKTIQAGMIVSELMRRGRAQRILVLTKKSMLAQFQSEFWNRFTIPLVRLDSDGIRKLRLRIPSNKNPFEVFYRVIISMDTLKDAARYRHFLEQTHWDVVIIDEAHNVAGASSPESNKSYKLARLLSERCENLLLTTATPHNGKPETFGRLVSLLDRSIISDPDLRKYDAEEIKGYFLMRFKEDVKDDLGSHLPERRVIALDETTVSATRPEEAVYAHLANLREGAKKGDFGKKNALIAYGLYKLFLSSPEACLETTKKRLKKEKGVSDAERSSLEKLWSLLEGQSLESSSRFKCLLTQLEAIGWDGRPDSPRVVIFTEYRETQKALFSAITEAFEIKKASLKHEDQPTQTVAMMHGGFPDKFLKDVIESFSTGNSPIRMLIATDVASEGINLHHQCHHLVHYDLPWSIITLVQRMGRIDRYGQTETPEIRYLMVKSSDERFSGDDVIFEKLIEKADVINQTTRSGGSVLQLYDAKLEEEYVAESGIITGNSGVLSEPAPGYEADSIDAILEKIRLGEVQLPGTGEIAEPKPVYGEESEDLSRIRLLTDEQYFEDGYRVVSEGSPDYRPLQTTPEQRLLVAPEDLRRYVGSPDQDEILFGATAIPDEAYPEGHEFSLTFSRRRVEGAIKAALNQSGHWSRETLLTDQHPVMLWLTEKLLMQFPRDEVPYVFSRDLEAGEICFLFVGQACSKSGLPLVVVPHAVSCLPGGRIKNASLRETLRRSGFDRLINDSRKTKVEVAQKLLAAAVESSRNYIEGILQEQSEGRKKGLTRMIRRVREWRRKREAHLEEKLSALPPTHPQRKKLQAEIDSLEETSKRLSDSISSNYLPENDVVTRPVLVIEGVK